MNWQMVTATVRYEVNTSVLKVYEGRRMMMEREREEERRRRRRKSVWQRY